MKTTKRSKSLCITTLVILAFCGSLPIVGQLPTPIPQTTSQTNPTPQEQAQIEAIKAKTEALIAEFQAPTRLVTEGQKLLREGTVESALAARAKFTEAVESARNFFKKLDDESISDLLTKDIRSDWKFITKGNEVNGLGGIGHTYHLLKDWQESVNYYKLALAVIQEMYQNPEIRASKYFPSAPIPIKATEADYLGSISSTLGAYLGKPLEALNYANQALTLWREVQREYKNFRATAEFKEALLLRQMAQSYQLLDDRQEALKYFGQALEVLKKLPQQKSLEGLTLLDIGNIHSGGLDYENASRHWNEALRVFEELGDKQAQEQVLEMIGLSYFSLNNEQRAREYFNRALALLLSDDYLESIEKGHRSVIPLPSEFKIEQSNTSVFYKDSREWQRSVSIGNIYGILKENENALKYYEKALISARAAKNQDMIRLSLTFISSIYSNQKEWQKALGYSQQALKISRQLSQKSLAASDLQNIGYIYFEMKNWQDALQNANEALLIYQSLGADKETLDIGYATVLNVIARTWDARNNRRLAIFFGKQAVNAIQRERQRLQKLNQEDQSGYLKKNEKPYRRLADWLIAEGRIAEAEQVLPIIKADEYFDYLRRDPRVAEELLNRISLSDDERDALKRFEAIASQIAALGRESNELEKESKNFEAGKFPKQARLDELNKELADARAVFNKFLEELDAKFRNSATNPTSLGVAEVSATRTLLNRLNQPRTVIISTIVGQDRLNLIITTAQASHAHTVEIKAADLNKLVLKFRAAVKNPNIDPRTAGKELYDALFPSELQKDLATVKADTIVWSLDGTLRYAPLAALWDGKQYLAEKYANSVITLASRNELKQSPPRRTNWTALGAGVSQGGMITGADGTPLAFASLPAVPEELCNVVNDPRKEKFCVRLRNGKSGILNGRNLADEEFTLDSFKLNLGKYSVVHIASHFYLNVGSENDSFLLLGGKDEANRKLTMAAVRKDLNRKFTGVELLTLSACDTAMSSGDRANGAEVESFGVLAQHQGATSVLATLWPIADPSTRDLMTALYKNLAINRRIGKARALRQAQLALLQGKYKAGETPLWRRGLNIKLSGVVSNQLPTFKWDEKARYAHPYYWSPFVLMGDWR